MLFYHRAGGRESLLIQASVEQCRDVSRNEGAYRRVGKPRELPKDGNAPLSERSRATGGVVARAARGETHSSLLRIS